MRLFGQDHLQSRDQQGGAEEFLEQHGVDPDGTAGKLLFNRTVTLKDTWAKIQQSQQVG